MLGVDRALAELGGRVRGDQEIEDDLRDDVRGDQVLGDEHVSTGKPIIYESPVSMKPVISFALEPKNKGDEDDYKYSIANKFYVKTPLH